MKWWGKRDGSGKGPPSAGGDGAGRSGSSHSTII
jgi:hypothetical protein